MFRSTFTAAVLFFLGSWHSAIAADVPKVDFSHDIAPILKTHCYECHGGEKAEGGFSINSRKLLLDGGNVLPGEPADSYMLDLVTSKDADEQMPPEGKPRVPAKDIALLKAWIDAGVPWQEGFTFAERTYEPPLLPREVELPPPRGGRTNPIDRIIDAYYAANKVDPPEPLGDRAFARRLYLDVLGIVPPPDLLQTFAADEASHKREQLITKVLSDRRNYTQHWLTFWNDLLRNAYSGTGFIDGGRKSITKWLYASLEENKPYDQFVQELISPTSGSEGFIRGIKWRGNVNASQTREIQFSQNVSQVFLGINMKCASCHDSFIDRWTLEEAYGLAAVYSAKPLEIYRCDKPTGKTVAPAWIFPEIGTVDPSAPQPQRLSQLAQLMTSPDNGRLTRTIVNRLWHRLMGRGIVHPVDAMHTEPWSADLLDYLAHYLAVHDYDLKKVIALIVSSHAYQSRAVVLQDALPSNEYVHRGPVAKRLTAEQLVDAIWQVTGTAPARQQAGVQPKHGAADGHPAFVRASMVKSDLLMRSLGRPNREQVVTSRPDELTTLQAIDLANGERLASMLRAGAKNLLATRSQNAGPAAYCNHLYLAMLSRKPTDGERQIAQDILGEEISAEGLEDLLWAILMLPEFQIIR